MAGLSEHKIGLNTSINNVSLPCYAFCFDETKSTHGGRDFFINEKYTEMVFFCFKVIHLINIKIFWIKSKENNWFRSFLPNKKQYVPINGFLSQTEIVRCGVPRGSTLRPLLFLIYINDLNNALDKYKVHHFADNTN